METGALSKVAQIGPPLSDPVFFEHGSIFYLCGSDASYTEHCLTSSSMLGDYEYVGPSRGSIKSRKYGRNAVPYICLNEILRPYQGCSKGYGEDFGSMSLKFERAELVPQSLIELKWEGFGGLFPEWLSEKRHHFSSVGWLSDIGYALIDGGTALRFGSHAWVADDYKAPFA